MRLFRLMLAAASVILCPLALHADTTYTYSGNPIDVTISQNPATVTIDGSFTVASPLAPDSTFSLTPESFSFGTFLETFSSSNPDDVVDSFTITTDASGDISAWDIYVYNNVYAVIPDYLTTTTANDSMGVEIAGYSIYGTNSDPGTWTESPIPTPEPSSIALLATGLLTAAGTIRRRIA